MNIAIIGYAVEGASSYRYFSAQGHDITICDQDPGKATPEGARTQLGEHYLDGLDRFDLIVRSAGIPPQVLTAKNRGIEPRITTAVNEFLRSCPTRNVIGVTGTKGKGTTSTLITKILEAAGKHACLGGNIGNSPLDFIHDLNAESWVVLELSSYQLSDLQSSPRIALCLMMQPDHLPWHGTMDSYTAAKANIFTHQSAHDIAIYYAPNEISARLAQLSPGTKVPYYAEPGATVTNDAIMIAGNTVCTTNELKLLGTHNWQNVCAAVTAVWHAGVRDIDAMRSVLTTFSGLPYRIEFRRTVGAIRYYNDSYSSAPPAALAAVQAVPGHKVLILGGYDRQLPLDDLAHGLAQNQDSIRHILLVGAARERLAAACDQSDLHNYTLSAAATMHDIVQEATALAQPGDAVVLSPGFPSYDMFRNFEDRGDQFNQAVAAL